MRSRGRTAGIVLVLVILALLSAHHLGLAADSLREGLHGVVVFTEEAFPPDLTVLDKAWLGLIETVEIAFLGTIIGIAIMFPLAVLAATNLFPPFVSLPLRWTLAAIRVLPSFLWAVIMVIITGQGALAGVIAMTLYTIGFMGKLTYEAIEGLPRITLDTARAMGLPRWQQIRHVVMPEAANNLLSQSLFMFEYNVRATTIIGVVGAGGIGYYLNLYLRFLRYDRVLAILAVIFLTVIIIDMLSLLIRRRYFDESGQQRPTWRDVFIPGWMRMPAR